MNKNTLIFIFLVVLAGFGFAYFQLSESKSNAQPGNKSGSEHQHVSVDGAETSTKGTVSLSAQKQQLINLRVTEAKEGPIQKTIRTVGVLKHDETRIVKIHPRIEGWVDKVYADYTGRFVRKGLPLFSVYSPELVSTQQEYLLALKAEKSLGESPFADVSSGARALRASAYQRLKLWDVSDSQISRLERTQTPINSITFYSPASGFVLERNLFEKQRITYESEIYSIADLSFIWLIADIYEYEAQNVRVGQDAIMTLAYDPKRSFHGNVAQIYPEVNSMTRTLKARIEFRNPHFLLKPDMYANVELRTAEGTGIIIPEEAVLDSGERKIVFVQKAAGQFEPRKVQTGDHFDGNVVVLSGLSAGEMVVASGNFLIDSESSMKSAVGSMSRPAHEHAQ